MKCHAKDRRKYLLVTAVGLLSVFYVSDARADGQSRKGLSLDAAIGYGFSFKAITSVRCVVASGISGWFRDRG